MLRVVQTESADRAALVEATYAFHRYIASRVPRNALAVLETTLPHRAHEPIAETSDVRLDPPQERRR